MKSIIRKTLLITILFVSFQGIRAQKALDPETVADLKKTANYAFVLTEERHFRGVLDLFDLLTASGVPISEYEIVVKGKVVTQLVQGSELEALYAKYRSKVRVSVCSVAMEILGVSENQLIEGLVVVPTASVRMLQLQANGYNSLTY